MRTFIIDQEQANKLKNLQVSFHLEGNLVVVDQLEFYDEFTGFYQNADKKKYPDHAISEIEEICMDWYNNIYSQTA